MSCLCPAIQSGSPAPLPSFPPGGDMLDFLVQAGEISKPDGLFASWYHRANSKEEMNEALASDVMILEADVTLRGYGTSSEEPVPIMAHPPAVHSDNTLDEWLDAVLASRKAMKLDFKALESVGLSLDLLSRKNSSQGLNRPVWLNADILIGPNTPGFMPTVTFPVHALLVRAGWQHLSWLLSQSPRFSLTLWQGSIHPNISDLLFVRDNSNPARVYYDIYEPTLSEFKEAIVVSVNLNMCLSRSL
uniref:Protein FAM151A n=1 Tax=Acanthochromis polyacanthus TaxID=80966 RepID=A0A3Q1G9T1_9TELE